MPRMLLFTVGHGHYGLELEALQEVADDPLRHYVPGTGNVLAGAVNVHGRILPVIDLPLLLGAADAVRDQRLVVLGPQFHGLALVVSAVGRIVPFEAENLELPVGDEGGGLVAGVVEVDSLRINLLDPGAVVERLETIYAV